NDQWEQIRAVIPAHLQRGPGRARAGDRRILDGILFVLRTGGRGQDLPDEYPRPSTCWRRCTRRRPDGTGAQIWPASAATLNRSDGPGQDGLQRFAATLQSRRPDERELGEQKVAWTAALFRGAFVVMKRGDR